MTATKSRPSRRVDPRMQARRRSVQRREGLRRLWIVVGLTAVASVAIGAIAIAKSTWLDVETVTIVGSVRSNPQQIATASQITVGEPLIEVDLDRAAQSVRNVPWVASATVDRNWGGEIVIRVSERVPVIAVPTGDRFAMIDATGQQLEVVATRPDGFFSIEGLEVSGVPGQTAGADAQLLIALVEALTPEVAAVTESLLISDGRLSIRLTVGGRAELGDDRDLVDKLVALETILARVDLVCVDVIDVEVPSSPTVRRQPPPAPTLDATTIPVPDSPNPSVEEPLVAQGGC